MHFQYRYVDIVRISSCDCFFVAGGRQFLMMVRCRVVKCTHNFYITNDVLPFNIWVKLCTGYHCQPIFISVKSEVTASECIMHRYAC